MLSYPCTLRADELFDPGIRISVRHGDNDISLRRRDTKIEIPDPFGNDLEFNPFDDDRLGGHRLFWEKGFDKIENEEL